MMVKFNPKDSNTFASASLDRTIKVWGLTANTPYFSLEGHERGVNCIDYYPGGDKPYLISGADDATLKIWDYQTKSVVTTLEGHSNNIASVVFHPRLPVVISGSEDGTVRIWHNTTYRLETTLNYGMERCWTLAVTDASNKVCVRASVGVGVGVAVGVAVAVGIGVAVCVCVCARVYRGAILVNSVSFCVDITVTVGYVAFRDCCTTSRCWSML
jgi:hypothetical protein